MAAPAFGIGLIVLVGLVGLVIGVLALMVNESTRAAGIGLGLILLLGGGLAAGFLFVRVTPSVSPPRPIPGPTITTSTPLPAERPLEEAPVLPSTEPIEKKPLPAPAPPSPAAEAPLPTTQPSVDKPAWVDRPGQLQGTIYRTTVKSGLFVTRAECEQAIEPKVKAAIAHYIDDYLAPDAARQVSLDDELLKRIRKDTYQETVTSATVGPMQQLHVLLEFDDAARAQLAARWQDRLVTQRLERTAIASGVVLSLLAIAFGYLKLDIATAGQMRGRLRFGAVAAILLVAVVASAARRALAL